VEFVDHQGADTRLAKQPQRQLLQHRQLHPRTQRSTQRATGGRAALRQPTAGEAMALVYLAVVVTAFAFFCWYDALPRLGPERAGLFSGFLPIGAIVSSLILGTGHPGVPDLLGAALVVGGLLIGLRPRRTPVQTGPETACEDHGDRVTR
jgi:EamA-like transporter family